MLRLLLRIAATCILGADLDFDLDFGNSLSDATMTDALGSNMSDAMSSGTTDNMLSFQGNPHEAWATQHGIDADTHEAWAKTHEMNGEMDLYEKEMTEANRLRDLQLEELKKASE